MARALCGGPHLIEAQIPIVRSVGLGVDRGWHGEEREHRERAADWAAECGYHVRGTAASAGVHTWARGWRAPEPLAGTTGPSNRIRRMTRPGHIRRGFGSKWLADGMHGEANYRCSLFPAARTRCALIRHLY